MAFTIQDLLLTEERKAQLVAALANLGVADPLAKVVAEAAADVARSTRGYLIDEAASNGWVRVLALEKAYLAAELNVPSDIIKAAIAARDELAAIAAGKRPNLPLANTGETAPSGTWGGETRIGLRL
jgi:uncharacterized membrane protein